MNRAFPFLKVINLLHNEQGLAAIVFEPEHISTLPSQIC